MDRPASVRYQFEMAFRLVVCECGEPRPALSTCPRCGSRELFPDPHVERRGTLIRRARAAANRPGRRPRPLGPRNLLTALGSWVPSMLAGVQAVAQGKDLGEALLTENLVRLRELIESAAISRRKRRDAALWGVIDRVLVDLRWMADAHLAILSAAEPDEARNFAELAQRHLDAAAQDANELLEDFGWPWPRSGFLLGAAVGAAADFSSSHRQ